MSQTAQFRIGSEVDCSDGVCGDLRKVVVDPVARALTHLVVEPRHRAGGAARLVPVGMVESTTDVVLLRCTTPEFEALADAEETQFLPGTADEWGYGPQDTFALPFYSLGGTDGGPLGPVGLIGPSGVGGPQAFTVDRVPAGEVEVRRGERVHATDGAIGRVRGLVVDPRDHHVTHVLLDEGHLWGQKRVAIPIGAVTGVEDGVRLSLSKDQVRDLPAVDLDQDNA
jgi:hypothetical protein